MATSSAMSTTNDSIKYKITITQNSQSVTNNTSNVTVSVNVYRTNTGYTTYGTGTVYCTINGTQYTASITSDDKITSSGIVLFSKTLNISHNADGTKTLATSAYISHSQFSSSSQNYSQTLTTIPRATTPTLSASSVNMGASITITMDRASSSFDHTLTYKFGDATGTIGSDLGTSKAWTVPLSLASEIPSGTSGTCTITCKTYSGTTLIGTKTVSFTAKVPTSVAPSISSLTVAEAVSGLATQFGAYVQNKSKLKVTINASGSYSSTIKSYKTTIAGKSYSGSSVTSGVITSSGTVTISTTVTDSRGRTATSSTTVSVLAYTAPQITKFSSARTDAGAQVTMNFSITSLSEKNTKSYTLAYKLKTNDTWITLTSGSVYSYDASDVYADIFSTESSYDMRLTVTDYFGSAVAYAELPTTFTLLDFNASGKGIAFGKVSELEEGIEFGMMTKFSNGEIPKDAIVLDSTTDLDELTEPGFYTFSDASYDTITNNPIGGKASGSVQVIREGDAGQVRQIVTRCSVAYREVWERLYYSSTWRKWMPIYKGGGNLLWSGSYYMTAAQTVTLAEPISKQTKGIVLVFSRYSGGEVRNYHFNSFFVSKEFVALHPGIGNTFMMTTDGSFSVVAAKYLYINDGTIVGNDINTATGTGLSGITYENSGFVLRYVIGV